MGLKTRCGCILKVFTSFLAFPGAGPSPDELEEKYTVEVWDSGTEEDGHCDTVFLSISDKFLQEIDGTKGDVSAIYCPHLHFLVTPLPGANCYARL